MKKQYDGMKVEKVEFDYEENVTASSDNPSNCCGHFEGNLEWVNGLRCACVWVSDATK